MTDIGGLESRTYWALKEGPERVTEIRRKVRRYFEACEQQGLITRWREQYNSYFMQKGKKGLGRADSTTLDLGTRKNPDVTIHIPEMRSLCRQQLAFLLAEPISFQVVSRTGDTRSVMGSEVGEKAVNYAYSEHIKPTLVDLAENHNIYGATASHLRWDMKKGDDVVETHQVPVVDPSTGQEQPKVSMSDELDENGNPIPNTGPDGYPLPLTDDEGNIVPELVEQKRLGKSGAPYREALDPTMFAYDPLQGPKANWIVAFERTNLYVLAAKLADYVHPVTQQPMPELAAEVLKQSTRDEYEPYRLNLWQDMYGADEGDCTIMHAYYADSPEVPKGWHVMIIGDLEVLMGECPLPAGRLPVRVLLNSKYTDCHLSFADSSGVAPIEEALNRIRSSELANYAYFGKQTRWQQAGTKVIAGEGQSRGEQRVLEGPRGTEPPQMLPINAMPPGSKDAKEELLESLARISGFGDVSRGQIQDTTSGAHAAVFEAITARNLSLPQAQLVEHETAVANDTLEMMQRFGNVEFIVEIAGKGGAPLARSFAPEDFGTIRRLVPKAIPDAMRGSLARVRLVELTKDIEDPREKAKAVQMILRGDDEYGRNDSRTQNLISIENEWLLSGEEPVAASVFDDQYAHMVDHKAAFDEYRTQPGADPQVLMRYQVHMQEHTDMLQMQEPVSCRLLGYPEPPVLPGSPAETFMMRLQESQQRLAMMPGGAGDPSVNPPPPESESEVPPKSKPKKSAKKKKVTA